MKKLIALLMAVTMCVGFSSCGNSSSDESSADKSEKEVTTEATTVKDVDFIEFYNNLSSKYKETFTDDKFDIFLKADESYLAFAMLSKELLNDLTFEELKAYNAIAQEFGDFMEENEQALNGSSKETKGGTLLKLTKKEE